MPLYPLPGQVANAIEDELAQNPCEGFNHEPCGKPSVHKVTGETDSLGSEYYFLCNECRQKERAYLQQNPPTGDCEWCKACNVRIFKRRDFEEGLSGRVYDVCGPCITKDNLRIQDDLDALY